MWRLVFGTFLALTVTFVVATEREGRQPRLTAHDPQFVGGLELIGGVQHAEMHFDFIFTAAKYRRAAARAEVLVMIWCRIV